MNILQIPPEIIENIMKLLDEDTLLNFIFTSRTFINNYHYFYIMTINNIIIKIIYDLFYKELSIIDNFNTFKVCIYHNINNILLYFKNCYKLRGKPSFYSYHTNFKINVKKYRYLFKNVSNNIIESYYLVLLNIIYNQIDKRKDKYYLLCKLNYK